MRATILRGALRPVPYAGRVSWSPAVSPALVLAAVPPEAISLALAASIYPPAVAAVIALGRGSEVRLRVCLLVGGAMLTVFATGALMLLVLGELPVSGRTHRTRSGVLEVVLGVALTGLAYRLFSRRARPPKEREPGESKIDRYLESRRLVLALGFVLYVVPSPIYVAALKSIADSGASTSTELAYLAVVVLVMLWMVELPMVMLLVVPGRSETALESVNAWFARNKRPLGIGAAGVGGILLVITGAVKLLE